MTIPRCDRTARSDEIAFNFDELFFSRTDPAGIILSGNATFQRISQYSWDELINKPHKLIRHPDMPRAVFWLLWNSLKNGKPIGAYVKNRAKDGRPYWVFAIVTPIEGGYLSVRIKPGSPLLELVQQEYAKLAALEVRERLTPADSSELLLQRLTELGFETYADFMAAALSEELACRNQHLSRPAPRAIQVFKDAMVAAQAIQKQVGGIFSAYAQNAFVSMNFKVQAAQLGRDGVTLGEISNNYSIISANLNNNLGAFMASARQVKVAITDGLFLLCTALVQAEVLDMFVHEPPLSGLDQAHEASLLEHQENSYRFLAIGSLRAIAGQAAYFRHDCDEMRRATAGLEVTRVFGKVECAKLAAAHNSLSGLLEELELFQKSITDGLKEIDHMTRRIQKNAAHLLAAAESADAR